MQVTPTRIPEVLLVEPRVFGDARGLFLESWNQRAFDEAVGMSVRFVQDNHSLSGRGVLRGLHYQLQQTQGKLVRVVQGCIFDVAVDLRRGAPTFGQWVGTELDAQSHRQLWVPPGFAHGFVVLSEQAQVLYKATDYYLPSAERCLAWDDPAVGVAWPLGELGGPPQLSARDAAGAAWAACEKFDIAMRPQPGE